MEDLGSHAPASVQEISTGAVGIKISEKAKINDKVWGIISK
jgi:hypothetical protein